MKLQVKLLSLAALSVALMTSCMNEGLQEPQDASALKMIPSLEEQAVAVEASVEELHDLQAALESHDVELEGVASFEQRAAALSQGGATLEEGTLAKFDLQKQLACIVGPAIAALDIETYESELKGSFNSLEKSVVKWVGKDFASLYPAALAEARTKAVVARFDSQLNKQKLYVDALASDVEAGLRNDEKPGELISLAASVQETAANSEKLTSDLAALAAEVDEEYEAAVKSLVSDPAGFDGATLKQFNANVGVELASVDNSLEGLASRVAACEAQLSSIIERLGSLETEIENLEELLDMIQSVTFLSEYSSDYAVAYYSLNMSGTADSQGRKPRTPNGTIELKYVVRPASAAAALTNQSLWNSGLKVFGYYAESMTKSAGEFFDLTIKGVTADQTTGVATITVDNAFNLKDFYFEETGAKVALSIVSGKTDLTSKFVEILPKDKSDAIYAETLNITDYIEIEKGDIVNIKAVLSPMDADQTLIWKSSNATVAKVSDAGLLTGWGDGTATITATSNVTDKWGRYLTATCNVKVNPDIKIVGPKYVEKGSSINLRLESGRYIDPSKITWSTSHTSNTSVEGSYTEGFNRATVKGESALYSSGYQDITITCKIEGETTLTHTIQCVEKQPRYIVIDGLENDDDEVTLKFGKSMNFNTSFSPGDVDATKFTLAYGISGDGLTASGSTITAKDESTLKNGKVTGYFNINLNSAYYWYDKTVQSSAEKLTRSITVNVEPYYVTGLKLPASYVMTKDQVLNPFNEDDFLVFTSDDPAGVELPSYTDLVWSSSNPESVSVDATTGKLTANKLTQSVVITARIKNPEKAVKPGVVVADATCVITVAAAGAGNPQVGDFYYNDGTWSTERDQNKEVVGVIFSLENPSNDETGDPMLDNSYIHGLVVSTKEFNARYSTYSNYQCPLADPNQNVTGDSIYEFVDDNYSGANYDLTKLNGYTSTLALKQRRAELSDKHDMLVNVLDNSSWPAAPSASSGWYIPSYMELTLLHNKKDNVNNSIGKVSGTQIQQRYYWSSSLYHYKSGSYEESGANPFDMTNCTMQPVTSGYGFPSTEYPVRLILAF